MANGKEKQLTLWNGEWGKRMVKNKMEIIFNEPSMPE